MRLTIQPFRSIAETLQTALSRSQAGAPDGTGRYARRPARLAALELALLRARPGGGWSMTWRARVALSVRLAFATRNGLAQPAGRAAPGPADPIGQAQPAAARTVAAAPVLLRAQTLVERLQARAVRYSPFNPRHTSPAVRQEQPRGRLRPPAAASTETRPGAPAPRVLLRHALPPAPAAPTPAALSAAGAAAPLPVGELPRPRLDARPPGLRLDQFPAHEVNRLADQVMQAIDRRILAQRERLGRI